MILDLILDAALLGVIIAIRESEFPGWGPMIGCVALTGLASGGARLLLPDSLALLSVVAGAGVATLLIAWLCETTLRRAAIAAGIWLGIRLVLALLMR